MLWKILTITVLVPAVTIILCLLLDPPGRMLITYVAFPVLLLIWVIRRFIAEGHRS
jgi:hypothetical protein